MAIGNIVAYVFAVVTVLSMAFLLRCFRAFVREIRAAGSAVTPNRAPLRRDLPFHRPEVVTRVSSHSTSEMSEANWAPAKRKNRASGS